MKKVLLLVLFMLLMFAGCASVHSGNYAEQISETDGWISDNLKETNLGLVISGQLNEDLESDYIDVINFSFENVTSEWIRLKNVKVYFEDEELNKTSKYVGGKDLLDWYEAIKDRNEIRRINKKIFLGSMTLLGGVVAEFGSDNISDLGEITAITGLASFDLLYINSQIDKVLDENHSKDFKYEEKEKIEKKVKIFPKSHLFYDRFNIPPGLYNKRWVAIHYPGKENKKPYNIILEYETLDGKKEKVKIQLRKMPVENITGQANMYENR